MLGIQHQENLSVPITHLAIANAREKQGRMINLGFHKVVFRQDKQTGEGIVSAEVETGISNRHFVDYHISRNPLSKIIGQIKSNQYWGKTNAVSLIDIDRVKFSGLEEAEWQS